MTKLVYSRQYTPDPARVRSVEDFSCPDPVKIVKVKAVKKRKPKTWAQLDERKLRKQARKQASNAQKALPRSRKFKKPKDTRTEEEKARARAEREAKYAEHNGSFLRLAAQRRRAMAAKKKSHRQAWAEAQSGLRRDRQALNREWRDKLLSERSS